MPLAKDLLYPDPEEERRKHKLKRLIQHPNSHFIDVKCPNCAEINITFSHSQTILRCKKCDLKLSRPTGGKVNINADCEIRRKGD